jgi:chloride channel 7
MGPNVIFVRPVEKVGVVYDILKSSEHSNFPVIDTDDNGILFGTTSRTALCILLQQRAFGKPKKDPFSNGDGAATYSSNYLETENQKFLPLVQWSIVEKSYPKYPSVDDLRISEADRECVVDLRPYANTAAVSIRESSSVEVGRAVVFAVCILLSLVYQLTPWPLSYSFHHL